MIRALLRPATMTAVLLVLSAWGAPVGAQGTGSVEGTAVAHLKPPRRTAPRYPGAGVSVHALQEVPVVVWVKGEVVGGAPRIPERAPRLEQRDTAFVPAAVAVRVGTRVSFPNADPFFHNVFSYSSSARFDLGRYPRGDAKTVVFDKPGVVKVYCEVHEFMRAVVVVTESAFQAVADAQGRFRIDGLPEGQHTVVVYHPDLEPVERVVRVRAGETTRLDVELR